MVEGDCLKIGITCYPTYGGSGAVATELGIALAASGHEIHFITYRQPFRLPAFLPNVYFHEVDVGRYPLFEYPPYDLALAVRMHEVVLPRARHPALPLRDSARDERVDRARDASRSRSADVKVITTLHGTDITIVGQDPSFNRDHEVLHREIGPSHRCLRISAARRPTRVRLHSMRRRGDSQLHRPRRLQPRGASAAAQGAVGETRRC